MSWWLRFGTVAAGVVLAVLGITLFVPAYRELTEFVVAMPCTDLPHRPAGLDCIREHDATVVDRRISVTTSTDSNGSSTTSTTHYVTLQIDDLGLQEIAVDERVYDRGTPGTTITVRSWRDAVVEVEAGDAVSSVMLASAFQRFCSMLAVWIGAGAVFGGIRRPFLVRGFSAFDRYGFAAAFGWAFLGAWTVGLGFGWGRIGEVTWASAAVAVPLLAFWYFAAFIIDGFLFDDWMSFRSRSHRRPLWAAVGLWALGLAWLLGTGRLAVLPAVAVLAAWAGGPAAAVLVPRWDRSDRSRPFTSGRFP